ncbi:MAG: histidine triad nucleotide-binding protein [Candidatus Hydrogenedentes bacterium]|nr:histidine triad nucleotide-binding protein [Candidatus Hydrogenedentota bacterium]
MSNDCLFCKIANGQIPSSQVYNDTHFYAFRDINPAAPSHILIIPRKHIERISEAAEADIELLGRLFLTANKVAEQEGLSDFRYVINCGPQAGQSVYHIHLHLLAGREFYWPPG